MNRKAKSGRLAVVLTMALLAVLLLSGFTNGKPSVSNLRASQSLNVGSRILFGSYEQDNRTSNGKESIEWVVLDVDGDDVLLISRYCLDVQPYDENGQNAIWSDCSLRSWMNDTFLTEAFTAEEQKAILSTAIVNHDNPEYGTEAGRNTTDKVFALGIEEAQKYFNADSERTAMPTEYAISRGAYVDDGNGAYIGESGNSCWWLRSPGQMADYASFVAVDGSIAAMGYYTWRTDRAPGPVRPAMWVNANYLPS